MEFMEIPNCPPPEGYIIITNGYIECGDFIWDRIAKRWALVFGILEIAAGIEIPHGLIIARMANFIGE